MELAIVYSPAKQQGFLPLADFQMLDQLCLHALQNEVVAWPKPGLVTPVDSGSHKDMNIGTFLQSIDALKGTFSEMAMAAALGHGFEAMMAIGRQTEAKMLRATNGINTHRGAIFNLGLLASAAALRSCNPDLTGLESGKIVSMQWGGKILAARPAYTASHGNLVFQRYAKAGARGEAATGFPMVYGYGIPVLRALLQEGYGHELALIGALMALIEQVDDSNLLWRGGEEGLAFAKKTAQEFNSNGGVTQSGWQDKLIRIHRSFMERRLSPGGSADLVAASWVAYHLDMQGTL